MSDTILDVQGLVGGYGKMTILNGTTFSVPAGSITTVIGPNGAGKSTVFKAIFGLLKLREGKILFKGRDVTGLSQRELLTSGICYVPQGRNIFPELSVRDNIQLGAVVAGRDITDLPARIEAALDKFPVLRKKATQQASTLSGGEQKQLEVARGLLLNPQLVLIDEPSIGLSPLMVQQTFNILKDLRDRGVSILMIEQNARSALEISDYGIVLELGQTRLVDTAQRVLNDPRIGQLFLGGAMTETCRMSGAVRIGVAGAGLIGRKHIELVAASSDCALAGIADPSPEAKAFAESRGIPWYADHRALLERETPDGMIVASPNALHLPMALDCVARGVPALVEKPVTDTVASAQRLCEAVRRSGVPVLVGHHRRHNPRIKAIRDKVAGGEIGQLTAVVGLWLLKKPDDYFDVAWRREAGGGPLLINLVHDIDNLRFICGEISEVQAMTSSKARGFAVEDTAGLLLKFAGGAIGTVTLSDTTPAPWSWELSSGENAAYPKQDQPCYLFAGTKGSLSVPTMELWSYPGEGGWYAPLSRAAVDVPSADPLVEQLRHFRAVIARSEIPLISVADAMGTLAVVEAVREAALTGARVSPGRIMEKAA